jgi:D-3-phosphoglycerate dehydrogenase / 2-oxoglutarate reductase
VNSMKVIINYQEYTDVEIEKAILREQPGIEIVESHSREAGDFANEVGDVEAAIIQYADCSKEVIGAMNRAKVIVRYGIAVDNIDVAAANARGIRVCNVPFYCIDEVSNHALAMILALHRKLNISDPLLRRNEYNLEALRPILRLSDLTVGLAGFGHIARRLAETLHPLFAQVIAFDPYVNAETMFESGVKKVELDALFRESDFVSVHAPNTPATRHLVSAEIISLMKPSAYIINTGRGPVIDESALIGALKSNRIAGAGLDVFESEPLPKDSPLRCLDNVIITSHYAWYSEGAIKELKETAAYEALRVLRGEEPKYEVKI